MDTILVLDFGGQTSQLISRRIRDFGVYSEIAAGNCRLNQVLHDGIKGIILSGSPQSAWKRNALVPDKAILTCGLPVLGICYGFHQLTLLDGGLVQPLSHREYGRSIVEQVHKNSLFDNVDDRFESWMSHGDSVAEAGHHFQTIAVSENSLIAAAAHRELPLWGLQFHPEASHCEFGDTILENFAVGICAAHKQWSLEEYIKTEGYSLKKHVDNREVLLLISGGVDSTVAAAFLLRTIDPDKIWLMYIDTGMMRKGESEEVAESLKSIGAKNLLLINAKERFLKPLQGVEDPETKRSIIGDVFMKVQEEEIANHLKPGYLLAQGTLYTDLIESGQGVGEQAQIIKSHHNVGTPLVQVKRKAGELIEPLAKLYKDEVRRLGEVLDLDPSIVHRHPFPGPGLAIRIISDVTRKKLDILREADAIFIEELKKRGLYNQIWQAFSILLPVRSVGVAGDSREYGYVLALRTVVSKDGMTADVFDFPMKDLLEISAKITNSVDDVGRVVFDVSSKPPATIEWE